MSFIKNNNQIIGIVIPTYQSQLKIRKLAFRIQKYLFKTNYFICFVDGSKNNRTIYEIRKYFDKKKFNIIKEKKRKTLLNLSTRCEASKTGFIWLLENKNCSVVVDLDSDLAHDPKDILKGSSKIINSNYDLVIASKYNQYSKVYKRKIIRKIVSAVYTFVCKKLISGQISDYSNSYRFYNPKILLKLVKEKRTFNSPAQHLENLIFFIKHRYKITEINSVYRDTGEKSRSIRSLHLIVFFFQILFILTKNYFRK